MILLLITVFCALNLFLQFPVRYPKIKVQFAIRVINLYGIMTRMKVDAHSFGTVDALETIIGFHQGNSVRLHALNHQQLVSYGILLSKVNKINFQLSLFDT